MHQNKPNIHITKTEKGKNFHYNQNSLDTSYNEMKIKIKTKN